MMTYPIPHFDLRAILIIKDSLLDWNSLTAMVTKGHIVVVQCQQSMVKLEVDLH